MIALSTYRRLVTPIVKSMTVLAPLLTRLSIGYIFVESGYGKLTHLDKTIGFFSSLGIPYPEFQAPLAAGMEWVCGLLILVGLATRLASVPLMVIMMVAIRTAKWEDVTDVSSLLGLSEFLLIVLLCWLIAYGSGHLSVDRLLLQRSKGRSQT